jgi:hypothetical protein
MNNFTRSGYNLPGKSGNGIAILLYPNPQGILSVRHLLFHLSGMGSLTVAKLLLALPLGSMLHA